MIWSSYLRKVLAEDNCLDGIKISVEGCDTDLLGIIKASVFLLQKMNDHQCGNGVFVFPEREQIPFLFMATNIIYNILKGKSAYQYSPEGFERGQLLKIGNCITQFLEVGDHPTLLGRKAIFLKFADWDRVCCSLDMAPYFQVTNTKRRLSRNAVYEKTKKKIQEETMDGNVSLSYVKALMTHMGESVAYVSTVADSERKIQKIRMNGEALSEYLLVAKTDYTGELSFYKGKYVGTPALILSSQVSHLNSAISKGAKVQSIIINLNECNIYNELDEIDILLKKKIPILCITDTINSMNLQELWNRSFYVWRWDKDNITEAISPNPIIDSELKIRNCIKSNVIYHCVVGEKISEAFGCIYPYNKKIENESSSMNLLFSELIHYAYLTVRNICGYSVEDCSLYLTALDKCVDILENERPFIDKEMYCDFQKAIECFNRIFDVPQNTPKTEVIFKLLISKKPSSFYIICSNNDDPRRVETYWRERLAQKEYWPKIIVVYAKEFIGLKKVDSDTAILAGWFSGEIIKRIIYGYKIENVHIFTYECEERWKKAHTKSWRLHLNRESNNEIIKRAFSDKIEGINTKDSNQERFDKNESEALKLQDDFDLIIQENKYRHYMAQGNAQTVDAKPIGFAGGDFALFTKGHKVLVVTTIILQTSKQIERKEVDDLKIGDFIVVRESDKDIIREVADRILKANNKLHYKKEAALWRESLKIEEAFSSTKEIYRRLVEAGCTRNFQTVKNWLTSEDLIIPQEVDDLRFIAEVTGDGVLAERIDEVFEAGNYIKNTHIKAGRILSERLMESIAAKLIEEKVDDPFNIWRPLEFEMEEVGNVKILKIIDIGQGDISVETSNTNRVLSEEKEVMLWQG